MTLERNSLGLVVVLFLVMAPTLALEKVFIYLHILVLMLVAFEPQIGQCIRDTCCFVHEKLPFGGYH